MESKTIRDIASVQTGPFGSQLHKKDYVMTGTPIVTVEHLGSRKMTIQNLPFVNDADKNRLSKYILCQGDIVFSRVGSVDRCSYVGPNEDGWLFSGRCLRVRCDRTKVEPLFVYYYFNYEQTKQLIRNIAVGATMPSINTTLLSEIPFFAPPLQTQKAIADTLSCLDDKIELNNKIIKNLEEQAQAIFINSFQSDIENLSNNKTLALENIISVIDNRGKTPPLSDNATEYPIIDVRALAGATRIINYNNCTKFIEKSTYNNWFRNGHPKPLDILISTVGSLAEIKFFIKQKGCIAQNVVGFRSKKISPYYLYQYLQYIKNNLMSYNIGSVQPSIKVTHIIKHKILIPDEKILSKFDSLIIPISEKIFFMTEETQQLIQLRDTLLPKLMSGEVRVPFNEVE